MDKHICKAKQAYGGEWMYGYYVETPWEYIGDTAHLIVERDVEYKNMGEFSWMGVHQVDKNTVCRCTGLEDSYGTSIFERDVVEFTTGSGHYRYLIWWNNEMSMMTAVPLNGIRFNGHDYWNSKHPKFEYSAFCLMMQDPYGDYSEVKVVGNIIDDEELMCACMCDFETTD